ncbi:MAG: L-threonylcarbamoyladenylate synthase [Terrimicrobiaceae bacterium]|nr:L-threonylcarbamoyladenylate synthase [Terrimicrobiaceae bacterium]
MKTRLVDPRAGLDEAAALLRSGETVAVPTETVYGLAADALQPSACAGIFEAKERPLSDPLIVHVADAADVDRLAEFPEPARRLAESYWPGPLTLVLPRRSIVPDIVTSGQETVAIRLPSHPVFRDLIRLARCPLAAPSANRFGRISPTSAADVLAELDGRIPLIVDGGPCAHGLESTIVLVDSKIHILRRGPITAEELARFGEVTSGRADVTTPGGLKSHYAPRTPLSIEAVPRPSPDAALLSWSLAGEGFGAVEFLSRSQDLREAAANLYGAMRRLDQGGWKRIVAEPLPARGLGAAIMERLEKAAAR